MIASLGFIVPLVSQASSGATVDLRVQTSTETIFNAPVYVSGDGCTVTDRSGTTHAIAGVQAICALVEAGAMGAFEYAVDYYDGLGLFLASINEYAAPADYSEFWSFFVNYESASVGLADYTVTEGDAILLAFGPYTMDALRLRIADNEILAGDAVVVRVQRLADATSQHFESVAGATVIFNDTVNVLTDAYGKAHYQPNQKSDTVTLYAMNTGAVRSMTQTMTVVDRNDAVKSVSQDVQAVMAADGVASLRAKMDDNGMILASQSLTEWAAMALAAHGESSDRLADAVLDYVPTVADGTNELARHILALAALGYNPQNVNGVDYIDRLKKTRSGKQFGSAAFVNDDIFAGLALLAAGEDGDSQSVRLAVRAAKQGIKADGGVSFAIASPTSDVDTTAFFIQFISAAQQAGSSIPITAAQKTATHYLVQQQNLDGGFGYADLSTSNAASSAVALQAMHSVDRSPQAIMRNKRTAHNYLAAVQQPSGQFAYSTDMSSSYDALNTAYAIIGLSQSALPVKQ